MKTSEQIDLIAAALAKAQGAMDGAIKAKSNPHLKSKYADLEAVVDAIKKPLAENCIAYLQSVGNTEADKWPVIVTRLVHSSGQWIESEPLTVPLAKLDAQGIGSATTYGRRYQLAALAGVAPEDDDGNDAATPPAPAAKPAETMPKPKRTETAPEEPATGKDARQPGGFVGISDGQLKLLRAKAKAIGLADDAAILAAHPRVDSANFSAVLAAMKSEAAA